MFDDFKILFYVLAGISLASCDCQRNMVPAASSQHSCQFRVACNDTIRGIILPKHCLEAINDLVTIQVTLYQAIERFDDDFDTKFLSTITSLKISATWKKAVLTILNYTNSLQTLHLEDMGLHTISGSPFYHLNHLKYLDLSRNKLTDIKELFQFEIQPKKLQYLSLAYNTIDDLPSFAFQELSSLIELDLSYNYISDLTEEPFQNLTSLRVLRLCNNRIKDLNGAVNNLFNLRHLYVRGNQIQSIDDESLEIIKHLETFDISSNELANVKPIMFSRHWSHFSNHSFCKIILSDNHISHIPNGIAKEISFRYVRNLDTQSTNIQTELDLSINAITNIEYDAFRSLVRLVSLNLSKNRIIDFIVNANDLAYLEHLNLSNNYISNLYYESFSAMNSLQNLDLSHNRLEFIPDTTFYNNYNLKNVNMTYNEIEKLDRIHIKKFHPEGGVLDLSNNGLFRLRVPYDEGSHLITLVLHSNNISDTTLIDLRHQTDLKNLYMNKNDIWELNFTSLHLPVKLEILELSCNKLQRIGPSTFHVLKHLKTLRLGNNQLTQLEYGTFEGMHALENLDLSYNRIGYLDSTLLTDLKSLYTLSLRSNGMNVLDYKTWYGLKRELVVYIDNNNFTCEWLGRALSDFNNGYLKMRLTVLVNSITANSLEGIPCVADVSAPYTDIGSQYVMADDRLLITSQRILEAVRAQNSYLNYFVRYALQNASSNFKKETQNPSA